MVVQDDDKNYQNNDHDDYDAYGLQDGNILVWIRFQVVMDLKQWYLFHESSTSMKQEQCKNIFKTITMMIDHNGDADNVTTV